jgi:hypothetical protein
MVVTVVPEELRMWLALGLGCLAVSLAAACLCAAISGASSGDKTGMIAFGAIAGVILGTVAPAILVLGKAGAVKTMSDAYVPMAVYAFISLSLVFLVEMLSLFAVVPVFIAFRAVRAWKRKG